MTLGLAGLPISLVRLTVRPPESALPIPRLTVPTQPPTREGRRPRAGLPEFWRVKVGRVSGPSSPASKASRSSACNCDAVDFAVAKESVRSLLGWPSDDVFGRLLVVAALESGLPVLVLVLVLVLSL